MGTRFRSLWQQIKAHPVASVLIAFVIALVVLVILGGYLFHWDWAGFNGNIKSGKTLWDWMQLLFIPVVLAIAGFWFNHRERKAVELRAENERKAAELRVQAERYIAEDNQREAALQSYINEMSELLLKEHLSELKPEYEEVRKIARVRTLTVLPRLDGKRKRSVLQFLYESDLIDKASRCIDLTGADLTKAHLMGTNLVGADLSKVNLYGAFMNRASMYLANLAGTNLRGARLSGADLSGVDLRGAKLSGASLVGTNLAGADLMGADLTEANLFGANLREAELFGADLSRANLTKTCLTPEQQDEATHQHAIMHGGPIHP